MRTPSPHLCRHRAFRSPIGLLLGAFLLLVSGCEKLRPEPGSPGVAAVAGADQKAKGENPFSVAVMRQAYANVIEPPCFECPDPAPNPDPKPGPVEATHLYVRFKPATVGQLADLDSLGYRLSWEPLDESVAAVTPVDYQSAEIPWVYTVVPAGTALPAAIAHEQLQELFLFTTEDGDVQDADLWEPAPEPPPAPPCVPQWNPTCQCYDQCVQSLAAGGTVATRKKGKPGKQAEATKKLKKAGVSPRALYNEAMRLSGHPEELLAAPAAPGTPPPSQTQLFGWTRYHPKGRILVQDTDLGPVPLRGVKVEARRWFNLDATYTDDQGNFSIGSGYLSLVKISLEFKNDLATTRGQSNAWQPWQSVLPINSELGSYEGSGMENIAYTITFQGGADKWQSKGASTWAAATLFNTLADAQTFSIARSLPIPARGINIWLFPTITDKGGISGSTPMLRRLASTSLSSYFIDFVLIGTGLLHLELVKQIVQRQLPDMTIFYANGQGALPSNQLNPLLYHELGHTQHYN